jgi:hypothetical protein
MQCLFCKVESSDSKSVEHIIPESLGNLSYTLPPGTVCDKCNNYFSRKVEKPFLESTAVLQLRFHQEIRSKRGKIPSMHGILAPNFPAIVRRDPKSYFTASVEVEPEAIRHIMNSKKGMLIFPAEGEPPPNLIVSRFLAKVGLEAMAHRLVAYSEGLKYLVNETQLDPIRNHARRGESPNWPIHARRIYDANQKWIDENGPEVQRVYEFDILWTPWNEWFFVLAMFGLELVINYGGPEIDGYERWLSENNNVSPLYWGKNQESLPIRSDG